MDLSKAFDCINRSTLLTKLEPILSIDNFRLLTYLLSNTTLTSRIQGTYGPKFNTTIGTPQGDSLSGLIFTVYMEIIYRELQNKPDIPNQFQRTTQTTYYHFNTQ